MKQISSLVFALLLFSLHAQHNNELYIKGDEFTIEAGAEVNVKGDFHVLGGTLTNNGYLKVQGNLYSDTVFQQRGIGTCRLQNDQVNTTERQFISGSYAVRGGSSQKGVNDGSFYNLELANDTGFIYLVGTGNIVDVRNSVNFDPLNTGNRNILVTHDIGTTWPITYPSNGSGYTAVFGLMNPTSGDANFINNTVAVNGAMSTSDDGYIIGNLRRQIDTLAGSYGFPLGLEPTDSANSRGLQYSSLSFNLGNTYDVITGFFEQGADNSLAIQAECSGYLIDYFGGTQSGQWFFQDIDSVEGGEYSLSVWPQSNTLATQSVYLITKDNAIVGTADDCGPSPVGLSRSGFNGFSSFGVAGGNTIALPVELLSIEANAIQNEFIRLNWKTATEINNHGFEIQRSEDGTNFTSIGWEDGNGNASNVIAYAYDDLEVSSDRIYYYRLKQIDFDGAFEYTPIVSASLKGQRSYALNVYPNPTKIGTQLFIDIDSPENTPSVLKIYNNIGQLVFEENAELVKGLNKYQINHTEMAAGQYIFVIQMNNTLLSKNLLLID